MANSGILRPVKSRGILTSIRGVGLSGRLPQGGMIEEGAEGVKSGWWNRDPEKGGVTRSYDDTGAKMKRKS